MTSSLKQQALPTHDDCLQDEQLGKEGIDEVNSTLGEGSSEMEEDKTAHDPPEGKTGPVEVDLGREDGNQMPSNLSEKVQEAVNRQTKRLSRKVFSPITNRRPLRELNKQESTQAKKGKRKISLRDEEMVDVSDENQKGKKQKSFEMMIVLGSDQVEVGSFPNGTPKGS